MAYKIAVASSDGINVDLHFGEAKSFHIYEVDDAGNFTEGQIRKYDESQETAGKKNSECCGGQKESGSCGGHGNGCTGAASAKVQIISDVRAVIAEKIGFNVTKQLEKKAISSFDVDVTVKEALEKVTAYYFKIDNHQTLVKK